MRNLKKKDPEEGLVEDTVQQIRYSAPARLGMETFLIRHGMRYSIQKTNTARLATLKGRRRSRAKPYNKRRAPFETANGDISQPLALPLQVPGPHQPVHDITLHSGSFNTRLFEKRDQLEQCPQCLMSKDAFLCLALLWMLSMFGALYAVNRVTGFPLDTIVNFLLRRRRRG